MTTGRMIILVSTCERVLQYILLLEPYLPGDTESVVDTIRELISITYDSMRGSGMQYTWD